MANIGVARASIYADLSATKYEKEAIKATERIAKTRTKSSAGDQVTFSAMEDTFAFGYRSEKRCHSIHDLRTRVSGCYNERSR